MISTSDDNIYTLKDFKTFKNSNGDLVLKVVYYLENKKTGGKIEVEFPDILLGFGEHKIPTMYMNTIVEEEPMEYLGVSPFFYHTRVKNNLVIETPMTPIPIKDESTGDLLWFKERITL